MRSFPKLFLSLTTSCLATIAGLSVAHAACANSNALGVSRTITIDATGGKLYGGLQYGVSDLLENREVILTFDDGPSRRNTRKVLKALASHCTKATFFMVGRMAVYDPKMVREVGAAGHTIANHTWSHKNLQRRNARRAGGEIELGISAVRIAAQKPISPFFRFPYLADPNAMIAYGKSRNLAIFSIDIDAYDYKTKSPGKVYSNIMKQLRSRRKGIMLYHDIQSSTANAMQRILDTLKRENYRIVHVVSKSPVKTIASFDAQAKALHDKKRTRATAKPIEGGAFENAKRVKRRTVSKAKPSKPKVASLEKKTRKPAPRVKQANPFSAGNSSPSVAPRTSVQRPSKDWRSSVWGNN